MASHGMRESAERFRKRLKSPFSSDRSLRCSESTESSQGQCGPSWFPFGQYYPVGRLPQNSANFCRNLLQVVFVHYASLHHVSVVLGDSGIPNLPDRPPHSIRAWRSNRRLPCSMKCCPGTGSDLHKTMLVSYPPLMCSQSMIDTPTTNVRLYFNV